MKNENPNICGTGAESVNKTGEYNSVQITHAVNAELLVKRSTAIFYNEYCFRFQLFYPQLSSIFTHLKL